MTTPKMPDGAPGTIVLVGEAPRKRGPSALLSERGHTYRAWKLVMRADKLLFDDDAQGAIPVLEEALEAARKAATTAHVSCGLQSCPHCTGSR